MTTVTVQEMAGRIGTEQVSDWVEVSQEMIDKLGPCADLGIDRVILNMNFGLEAQQTLESIQCFAEEVMPQFTSKTDVIAAE